MSQKPLSEHTEDPSEDQEEDSALDESLKDKSSWPAHLDVEIKEAAYKLIPLYRWLVKSGLKKEAKSLEDIFLKNSRLQRD